MIYLTGDVHGRISGNWEQDNHRSEVENSLRYLEILKKYRLSCTLFINGICLEKDVKKVKELLNFDIELGGHTYDNFGSMNIYKSYLYRKFYNGIYGPDWYQKKDIKKTKNIFNKFNLKMTSWRTHSFGSNENTFRILRDNGVRFVSDLLGNQKPFEKNGIIHLPINIPVDVVSISYGYYRPENRDPFASCTKGRINPEEWFEILKRRVENNEKKDLDSVMLIHPQTMAVLDDFKLFDRIAKFLSKYKLKKVSEFSFQ